MTQSNSKSIRIPGDFVLVSSTTVAADAELNAQCRGLLVGVAGFLNVTMKNGQERDAVPFVVGINPGDFAEVRISTGTGAAQNIWQVL